MSRQSWQETLITAEVDGSALTNTTTAASLLPAVARYAFPANYFEVGRILRVSAKGRISTVVTTPGTLTLDLRLGTIATPIIVFNGGALALNATAQTNQTWSFEALLTCRAIGAPTSALLIGTGSFASRALLGTPAVGTEQGVAVALLPETAPAVGTGFDSSITNYFDMFAAWSVANAANSIQLHQFSLESMN